MYALAILLGGAAPPAPDPKLAADNFYRCAEMFITSYDDGISPANIVAKAIANKCQTDALGWVNALAQSKTMNRDAAMEIFQEAMRGDDANLIMAVLEHRVAKRR